MDLFLSWNLYTSILGQLFSVVIFNYFKERKKEKKQLRSLTSRLINGFILSQFTKI